MRITWKIKKSFGTVSTEVTISVSQVFEGSFASVLLVIFIEQLLITFSRDRLKKISESFERKQRLKILFRTPQKHKKNGEMELGASEIRKILFKTGLRAGKSAGKANISMINRGKWENGHKNCF